MCWQMSWLAPVMAARSPAPSDPVSDASAGTCRTPTEPTGLFHGDQAAAARWRSGLPRPRSCSIAHR